MKKLLALVLVLSGAFVFVLGGCSLGKKTDYTVGVIQLVTHDALDAANRGFVEELTKLMEEKGKTIKFDQKNAQDNKDTAAAIAEAFNAKRPSLVLAIATPAAQAAVAAIQDTPILFTAVTDPVDARLVDTMEIPKHNASGTSDLTPVAQQIQLIKKIVPNAKKVALLYSSAEANSLVQIKLAEAEIAKTPGLTSEREPISDVNTIDSVIAAIDADVIYIPTDNKIASIADNIHAANLSGKKIPVITGEEALNNKCGVATYGINYYELGKQTAQMAFKILFEGADVSKMPVEYQSREPRLAINAQIAAELGISQEILDSLAD